MLTKIAVLRSIVFILGLSIAVFLTSFTAVAQDVYVRYQAELKNVSMSEEYDSQGKKKVSSFSVGKGSKLYSARGEETFVGADVVGGVVVSGSALVRIAPHQKIYVFASAMREVYDFYKSQGQKEGEFLTLPSMNKNLSTAEVTIGDKFATITGLKGVEGGQDGFLVLIVGNKITSNHVALPFLLGGRFKFIEVKGD